MQSKQPTAQDYLNAGFKAIKCKGYNRTFNRNEKGSDAEYKEAKAALTTGFTDPGYQSLTPEEIKTWESTGGWTGWVIPQGLIALDIENADDAALVRRICEDQWLTMAIHKTTNGWHFIFRLGEELKAQTKAGINCGIHVTYRVGSKNYLILAPTLGRSWEDWDSMATLSPLPNEFKPCEKVTPQSSEPKAEQTGNRPGDMFAEKNSWASILEPHGWRFSYKHGDVEHWIRPGKDSGSSATIGHHGTDYFHCFTSSSQFDPDKSYNKFTVYAILNHGGDYKAAALDLAKQGYGDPLPEKNTASNSTLEQDVREWIDGQFCEFTLAQCQRELCVKTKEDYAIVRKSFTDLFRDGIIGHNSGKFYLSNTQYRLIEPVMSEPLPINWPLNLQEITQLKPKELMTVAGVYGAGKTAFCLNLAQNNLFLFEKPIRYIASELNEHDLAWKLQHMTLLSMNRNTRCLFMERMAKPWELIDPEALNIIDYLERHDDFFSIGADLAKCQARLKTGVAIVCLQKNPGSETARGGAGTMQKPALVLNLEKGEAQIKKVRYWADQHTNPMNMKVGFELRHSVIFENVSEWYASVEVEDELAMKRGKRK